MAKFCLYYGSDVALIDRLRDAAIFCWRDIEETVLDSFRLFVAADDRERYFCKTDDLIGAISGYARRDDVGPTEFFEELSDGSWPLGDEWTGSFAAAVYSPPSSEVTLCNDLIGHFPLYYANCETGFLAGSSLIVMGRGLKSEPDPIGVLQRITVPFCNYGKRTLLKNVFRLLPGERLKWRSNGSAIRRDYDNSLYGFTLNIDLENCARLVWDCLRTEIITSIDNSPALSIATSGGWDSRLVLGAFPRDGTAVNCLTYGGDDHYETGIARRCAETVGASHESISIVGKYFPSRNQVEDLVKETESANYFEWFGMIERARLTGTKQPLLLGDLCESIDARYMTSFSSRRARINSFLDGFVGKREVFKEGSDEAFQEWKEAEAARITSVLLSNRRHLSEELIGSLSETQFAEEIAADLEISFARVRDNAPPYSAMYDELFIWFHRIRFLLGNQITWLSSAFHPVSPGLSMRFLRLITKIHPQQKVRRRLMDAIMKLPEFDKLSRIPSAQVPFVSSRTPALIKDILWGLRSGVDQMLIRNTMHRKDPKGRQRVLMSLDYVSEYYRDNTRANVEGWFSGRYIDGNDFVRLVRERARLDAWTLINVDIAAPANVSIVLDLCSPESQRTTAKVSEAAATYSYY